MHVYNLDGREFVRTILKFDLLHRWNPACAAVGNKIHVVMNLPATAIEFLDVFKGLISFKDLSECNVAPEYIILPIIHCYCFSKSSNALTDARERTKSALGVHNLEFCDIRMVRNVAPNKEMMCVSFVMPRSALLTNQANTRLAPCHH